MSNKKDFATSTVLTAPTTPTAGTSLVVAAGHGARFPAVPFYVVAHPPTEFPTLDNAEKLLVTAKSTDTFTITRAQGDTTAKSIEAGWRISNAVFLADFPATFDDLVDGTTNKGYTNTEKTKLAGISTGADVTSAGLAPAIFAATDKATPVDADTIGITDSAASNALKKLTWANLKATLKTYFDSLTTTLSNKTLNSTNILSDVLLSGSASAPATPSTGYGRFSGAGTSTVRPKYINSSGTLETIYTDKNNEVYSTSEVDTGKKWTDGSTIYRKVLNTTFNAVPGTIAVNHGISGMGSTYKFLSITGGFAIGTTSDRTQQSFTYRETGGNWMNLVSMNTTTLTIGCSFNWGTSRIIAVMEYVK